MCIYTEKELRDTFNIVTLISSREWENGDEGRNFTIYFKSFYTVCLLLIK